MPLMRAKKQPQKDLAALVANVGFWWHSIDLGGGVVTPGFNSPEFLTYEWQRMAVPDLAGKTVLDIGAWDGYFSFRAEAAGARDVLAMDHYVWSLDLRAQQEYWKRCIAEGTTPRPYHELEFWRPRDMPGKAGFDTAKRALGSRVASHTEDFMTADLKRLGSFDVVFYLGVLYHMEQPFEALKRLAAVTKEVAVIATQAICVPGHEDHALWEFFPGAELNNDVSNWWAPNLAGLHGMCSAAGFSEIRTIAGPPEDRPDAALQRYSTIVHAYR